MSHRHEFHDDPRAHLQQIAAMRRYVRSPRGFGPGFEGEGFDGPPFGPFGRPIGPGPRGRGRSRVRRGQIRTALLALLEEEPMHGYEMIRQIDERSGGRWKPSPGAVYPTLQQLSDEGLITSTEDSGKNVFTLTDEGRSAVAELTDEDREPWTADPGGSAVWELKAQMRQLGMAAAAAMQGTPDQVDRAMAILADARRNLYAILAEDPGTSTTAPEEDEGDA